jgi:tetratricopeptide (TPR) repeat protein
MELRNGGSRLLRLTEHAESAPGRYRVEITLEGAGPRFAIASPLDLALTAQDREDLRWYLEDYLLFPLAPAPEIAARVEARMAEIGDVLFRAIFHATEDARDAWARLRDHLGETRVEIITDVRHAASVPWELLRDPRTKTPLALSVSSFVRAHGSAIVRPRGAPAAGTGPIRILLVICRPSGGKDVPFRSVASKLLKGLAEAAREVVQLDVLRPPTFAELGRVLRAAKDRGKPYHVVHFDGHGAYLDAAEEEIGDVLSGLSAHVLGGQRKGAHGYLVFESPEEAAKDRGQLVDGPSLGKLLVATGVPVLVLNACRSAHADPPAEPEKAGEGASDTHGDIESFGSLALEVMDTGVSGVVAMRYNVYVATAAQFVMDLYGALTDGLALGEAVTRGRKLLHDQPLRTIGYEACSLQDWAVPVVYEAESLPLFPAPVSSRGITLSLDTKAGGGDGASLVGVPPEPDAGFFGRDETLLALDRAFDKHAIVLLHAHAGSGKSSAAAEFARWYQRTGGVEGPVLWTSFERRMVLPQVLDVLGRVFEPVLAKNKIAWLALSDEDRRRIALQILGQTPVLWIWDNVEPVAGFPASTASAWSEDEQWDLADFLREARGKKAKFLLTSRREEQAWLGELPARIAIPRMPMQERVQLARALASKRGARLDEVADWKPLLAFTQGNPLAITVLVGQALRDGLRTKAQIAAFVARLHAGESAFQDEASEGRSRSLGASLRYGFGSAFGEEDRRRLALLHLFQGFVQVGTLRTMGDPEVDWCLPEVRGLTQEAGTALLDRAAEIGLLSAHGGGYYSIHPAVPWFFRGMFEEHYPAVRAQGEGSDATSAMRAYVGAMGELGDLYYGRYQADHRDHLAILKSEEPNLLHARDLARRHGWWTGAIGAMQGLRGLHDHTGRQAEWARRVDEVRDDFVDPETDGPLPGREDGWVFVNEYRVHLAEEARQWAEAERLQRAAVRWAREQAAAALALPAEVLDAAQRNRIRTLGVSLGTLGNIQRGRGQADCIASYTEATEMAERAGDRAGEARVAFGLGNAYKDLSAVRDLAEAERWYQRSLEMREEQQPHGRARGLGQLGIVAYERFNEALAARRPEKELIEHLDAALRSCHEALELIPPDAVNDLAVTHNLLGLICSRAGDLDRALPHYQHSIRYREEQGDLYGAAQTRGNVAITLAKVGRLADARAYALAALRNYETYGDRAADEIQNTHRLLAAIGQSQNRRTTS